MNIKLARILLFIVIFLGITLPKGMAFDLSELKIETGYSSGTGRTDAIQQVDGIGATVEFAWKLTSNLKFGLSAGYVYYNVNEDSALYTWNWDYYNRLYRGTLSEYRNNPNYAVDVNPEQYLKLKPVQLSLQWSPTTLLGISPRINLAGGVAHYRRKLWLNEDWQKYFEIPAAPDSTYEYTFEYSFHNYAQAKSSWVLATSGQLAFDIGLSKHFGMSIFGKFSAYSDFREDSKDFPLSNTYQIGAAIRLFY